jgi:ATP-binding cassette, subfamily B, bacterial
MQDRKPLLPALSRSMKEIWSAAPRELRRLLLLNLIVGAGPVIALLLQKTIIDYFAGVMAQTGTTRGAVGAPLPLAIGLSAALLILTNIALDSIETLSGFQFASLRDRVQGHLRVRIFETVAAFHDITLFENPALLNIKQAAQQAIPRVQQLAQVLGNLMTGVFVFVPAFLVSFSIAWWVPLLIFVTAMPSIYFQMKYEDSAWSIEYSQAGLMREMALYEQVLTHENFAKEVRMFGIQGHVLARWRALFKTAFDTVTGVRGRGARVIGAWSLLSGVGIAAAFVHIFVSIANGAISLGDLALYSGLIFQVRRSVYILLGNATSLREAALASAAIFQLLDLRPVGATPTAPAAAIDGAQQPATGLMLQNVAFTYPGVG